MRCRHWWLGFAVMCLGCGIAPRHFRALNDPSPIVRARAVGLGKNLPDREVLPALIDRLEDPEPVVRMSANEELRRRTGQDFGFVAWSAPDVRARSVAQWRAWWNSQQPGLANSRPMP